MLYSIESHCPIRNLVLYGLVPQSKFGRIALGLNLAIFDRDDPRQDLTVLMEPAATEICSIQLSHRNLAEFNRISPGQNLAKQA